MVRILVLEDNLKVINAIVEALKDLEIETGVIGVTIMSEGRTAEDFLRNFEVEKFDVVLLDYLSQDDRNFHQAVLRKIDSKKIIAISNSLAYNNLACNKGVLRSIQKDYFDLGDFKVKIKKEILGILN